MRKSFGWIFLALSLLLSAYEAPYDRSKFRAVLADAKLQAPGSKYNEKYGVKYGEFDGVAHRYFYRDKSGNMVFEMCGKKQRSELRFRTDWSTAAATPKVLEARVKLYPMDEKREFTFIQIHADSTLDDVPKINKPLLRLNWRKNYHGKKDHIWAHILSTNHITKSKKSPYVKIDLGKRPSGFFNVKVEVRKSRMKIWVNGKKKVDMDVSYWDRFQNYFKAGAYLQDEGCAKVKFKSLKVRYK